MSTDRCPATIAYRMATADDLVALARLRWEMEEERLGPLSLGGAPAGPLASGIWPRVGGGGTGQREPTLDLDAYVAAYEAAIRDDLERGTYRAWLAEADGEAIACVVLVWWVVPPHFDELNRRRGWVSSVYCRPAYRRRSITRLLMQHLVEYARANNVLRLILWSSEMGRPLYESLGFRPSSAMELNL